MSSILIKNVGKIVSGNYQKPLSDGDSIRVKDGKIEQIGNGFGSDGADVIIDAKGLVVTPGLIDSHVHPVLGDFTPRQNTLGYFDACVNGGVTTFISAGEVHTPGRPRDPVGAKAMAILAHKSFQNLKPGGAKVHAGALMLEKGLVEEDFSELKKAGVWLVGEIGLGTVQDADEAALMVKWAHNYGFKCVIHTGGASIAGSAVIGADFVLKTQPDIVSHINGGPTAPPFEDIRRIIQESNLTYEIVHCGNGKAMLEALKIADQEGKMDKMIIGNDAPSGTGIIPLGILRVVTATSSLGGLSPANAFALATGNTGRAFGLNIGTIEPGREADLIVMDAPYGSTAKDALEAVQLGDLPGIAAVIIDGELKVQKSRMTPPPGRNIEIRGKTNAPASPGH